MPNVRQTKTLLWRLRYHCWPHSMKWARFWTQFSLSCVCFNKTTANTAATHLDSFLASGFVASTRGSPSVEGVTVDTTPAFCRLHIQPTAIPNPNATRTETASAATTGKRSGISKGSYPQTAVPHTILASSESAANSKVTRTATSLGDGICKEKCHPSASTGPANACKTHTADPVHSPCA
jgi:hypothetical protein